MKIIYITLILLASFLGSTFSQTPTIGVLKNDSLSVNGFSLFTVDKSTYLIDNCGHEINQWTSSYSPGLSVYLLENGNLMRCGRIAGAFQGGGIGGIVEEFDWEGNLLWSYRIASPLQHQHHDIEILPNGNILAIVWESKSSGEAIEQGAAQNRTYWPDAILELEKVGIDQANIVWEWHTWDHLIQNYDSTKANYGVISEHPELININFEIPTGSGDWQHSNGIDFNPERDEIIVSARSFDEIFIIDHSTTTAEAASHTGGNRGKGGDLLYRWGNPESYNMGMNTDKKLFGQHNASFIPSGYPDEGKVIIFNNGGGRPGGSHSTSDIIELPFDANGNYLLNAQGRFGPDTVYWSYSATPPQSMYSTNQGGTQALSNGNVLITSSTQSTFREVTREGEVVWLYQNPIGPQGPLQQGVQPTTQNTTRAFRIERYAPDFEGFIGKNMTPGDVLELNPYPSTCDIYDGMVSILPKVSIEDVSIFPSTTSHFFHIENESQRALNIQVFDLNGKLWQNKLISIEKDIFDISQLPNGLYIVLCSDLNTQTFFSQKIIKI